MRIESTTNRNSGGCDGGGRGGLISSKKGVFSIGEGRFLTHEGHVLVRRG